MNYLLKSLAFIAGSALALYYFPVTTIIILSIFCAMAVAIFIRSVIAAIDFIIDVFYPDKGIYYN